MHIVAVDTRHKLRPAVETHIRTVYRRAFGAEVGTFARHLYAAFDADGAVRCAAGVRRAAEAFHCECYLDSPAEQAIARGLNRPVCRDEILEFSTLACRRPGEALAFVSEIVEQGRLEGCGLAMFTGTAPLRRLLARSGLTIVPIGRAERARVPDPGAWGRYYAFDPQICVAPDSPALARRLRAPCFRSLRPAAASAIAPLADAVLPAIPLAGTPGIQHA